MARDRTFDRHLARTTARLLLGLTFAMAGWWKVSELGAAKHAEGFFVAQFAETWIPSFVLRALGYTIPYLELIAGAMVILGLRLRESMTTLAAILVVVTYGHLLIEPLYSLKDHIFIRAGLLLTVLLVPGEDAWSVDAWLARRARS